MKVITYMFAMFAFGLGVGASQDAVFIIVITGIVAFGLWNFHKLILLTTLKTDEVGHLVTKFTREVTERVVTEDVADILKAVLNKLKKNARTHVVNLKLPEGVGSVVEREITNIFETTLTEGVKFKTRNGASGLMAMARRGEEEENESVEAFDMSKKEDVDKLIEKLRNLRK